MVCVRAGGEKADFVTEKLNNLKARKGVTSNIPLEVFRHARCRRVWPMFPLFGGTVLKRVDENPYGSWCKSGRRGDRLCIRS